MLLWSRAPALEPALVETADDVFKRVFLGLPLPVAARIGVLGGKLRLGRVKGDCLVQLRPLKPVGRQVDRLEQLVERILAGVLNLQLRYQELQESEKLFPAHHLEGHDQRHLAVDLHKLLGLDLVVDLVLVLEVQLPVEPPGGGIDQRT